MNSCGSCNVCCAGTLIADIHGHKMGNGTPCHFLKNEKCSIYSDRPEVCREYYCLYAQDIIPNLQRPDTNGIMVTIQDSYSINQYLSYTLMMGYDEEQLKLIKKFAIENKTYALESVNLRNGSNLLIDIFIQNNNKKLVKQSIGYLLPLVSTPQDIIYLASKLNEVKLFKEAKEVLSNLIYNKELFNTLNSYDQYQMIKNLFNILLNTNDIHEASNLLENILSEVDTNLITDKDWLQKKEQETEFDRAVIQKSLGNREKAKEIYNGILKTQNLSKDIFPKINYNFSSIDFWDGNFKEGMKKFITYGPLLNSWNDDCMFFAEAMEYKNKIKKWDGTPVPGANIIVYSIAGLGDVFINFRFYKILKNMGMNVIIKTITPLEEFFNNRNFHTIQKLQEVAHKDNLYYVNDLHLPYVLDLDTDDLWDGPYIKAMPEYINKWKEKTKTNKKLKIGIRWSGNPDYEHDLHRSVPLKQIYESVKHLDADFHCLQLDGYEKEWNDFPGLIDTQKDIKSWEDTFGFIENMDIVITSCTSVAHAAAAMGKRTFVFTPIQNYYTWSYGPELNSTPWYGENVTVLYQKTPAIWDEPAKLLRDTLLLEYK